MRAEDPRRDSEGRRPPCRHASRRGGRLSPRADSGGPRAAPPSRRTSRSVPGRRSNRRRRRRSPRNVLQRLRPRTDPLESDGPSAVRRGLDAHRHARTLGMRPLPGGAGVRVSRAGDQRGVDRREPAHVQARVPERARPVRRRRGAASLSSWGGTIESRTSRPRGSIQTSAMPGSRAPG